MVSNHVFQEQHFVLSHSWFPNKTISAEIATPRLARLLRRVRLLLVNDGELADSAAADCVCRVGRALPRAPPAVDCLGFACRVRPARCAPRARTRPPALQPLATVLCCPTARAGSVGRAARGRVRLPPRAARART